MINGLGQRLQEQRILRNLSQKQVASSIGVSASVISNYESGERTPSIEILIALSHLYHCSTDYLLGIGRADVVKLLDVSMLNDKQYRLLQAFLSSLRE
ncbi:MAG: helix-turn-helix domain-containing protein [Lachnospiraceae bacterium]|nr:helix-turn-helix domain-containing protein [Lachnospiraceae bacterium]